MQIDHFTPAGRVAASAGLIAALAAGVGYTAHHATPLAPHTAGTVALVVAASVAIALVSLVVASGRRHPPPPPVVVAAPGATVVRRAQRDQAAFCAALHAHTLPHGFFVALGPRFLRAYYLTFFDSPYAVALTATAREHPIGMVVGVTSPRAHARLVLRKHGLRLALVGVAALLTRPVVGLRFARTRFARYAGAWRRHRARPSDPETVDPPAAARRTAILSHLAVTPGARHAGVGGQLVDAFVAASRAAGADQVVLVTLADEHGAGAFYAARGWVSGPVHSTPDRQVMREWTLEL